jgi:hypothetical protein
MATRPIFIPRYDANHLFEEMPLDFNWHSGFAVVQKKKNIATLHSAAKARGLAHVLEVSTKSEEKIGVRLSAFSLKVTTPDGFSVPLESAYQGSKVFEHGGPFTDLFFAEPRDAKQDERLRTHGALKCFKFGDAEWELEPKTAFYDWLYLFALKDHAEFLQQRLYDYDGFSDIEFNPKKSYSCQARTCAMLVSLLKKKLFPDIVYDRELFIKILKQTNFEAIDNNKLVQQTNLIYSQ